MTIHHPVAFFILVTMAIFYTREALSPKSPGPWQNFCTLLASAILLLVLWIEGVVSL